MKMDKTVQEKASKMDSRCCYGNLQMLVKLLMC